MSASRIRPTRIKTLSDLIDGTLDGVPTGRRPGAKDGRVAEFLAGVLDPFAVLGWVASACVVFANGREENLGAGKFTFGCSGWAGWLGSEKRDFH